MEEQKELGCRCAIKCWKLAVLCDWAWGVANSSSKMNMHSVTACVYKATEQHRQRCCPLNTNEGVRLFMYLQYSPCVYILVNSLNIQKPSMPCWDEKKVQLYHPARYLRGATESLPSHCVYKAATHEIVSTTLTYKWDDCIWPMCHWGSRVQEHQHRKGGAFFFWVIKC